MYEKALAKAREQRYATEKRFADLDADLAVATQQREQAELAVVEAFAALFDGEVIIPPVEAPLPTAAAKRGIQIPEIPAIEVTPVIATSTPSPHRRHRRRVHSVLLIPFRIAAMLIIVVGLVGSGIVFGTLKGGDLSVRDYVDAMQDLPAMIVSKPCNFDHVNGTGCKS